MKNCIMCGQPLVRRKTESDTTFTARRYCSPACSNKNKVHLTRKEYTVQQNRTPAEEVKHSRDCDAILLLLMDGGTLCDI